MQSALIIPIARFWIKKTQKIVHNGLPTTQVPHVGKKKCPKKRVWGTYGSQCMAARNNK